LGLGDRAVPDGILAARSGNSSGFISGSTAASAFDSCTSVATGFGSVGAKSKLRPMSADFAAAGEMPSTTVIKLSASTK
jgi:hypothetical protein